MMRNFTYVQFKILSTECSESCVTILLNKLGEKLTLLRNFKLLHFTLMKKEIEKDSILSRIKIWKFFFFYKGFWKQRIMNVNSVYVQYFYIYYY